MNKGKSTPFSFKPTAKIIAVSIAAAFALSACGGDGDDDDNGNGGGGGGGTSTIAYVTQLGAAGAGGILQCSAASDGMLTCTPEADASANTLPAPVAISLNGSSAYILNGATEGEAPTAETIYKCSVAADGGAVSACAEETGADNEQLPGAKDIAVSGGNLYVLKETQMLKCSLTDGTVGACNDEGMTVEGLNVAEAFAFSGNRVWIANSGGAGSVLTCTVASGDGGTGAVSDCAEAWTSSADANPAPLNVALDTGGTNAYILLRDTNDGAGSILRCSVGATDTDPALTCDDEVTAATALPAAAGSVERIAVNNGYVYVTRTSDEAADNSVVKCTVGTGGAIDAASCVSAVAVADPSPITGEVTDIAFK